MKKAFQILLLLIANSVISQNIWEPIILHDSLKAYDVNAEKDGVLFIGATSNNGFTGLFKSTDDGVTWVFIEIDSVIPSNYINAIRYNNDGILFINATWGIYKSLDDGDTFEKVSPSIGSIQTMRISPDSLIYAVGWDGIIRSGDNGLTWDTLFNPPNTQYFSDIDFGPNNEIYVVGGTYHPWGGGFFRSLDNGITWEENSPCNCQLHSIRVKSNGTIIVSGFSADKAYHSYDNGSSWTQISNICADVLESNLEDRLVAGRNINSHIGCWFSDDWGHTWVDLVDSIINPNIRHISISTTNTVYVQSSYNSSYDHHLFKSINPIVGSNSLTYHSSIEIYPNPADEKITILNRTSKKILSFSIFNSSGQKLDSFLNWNSGIDVSNFKPGLYIIVLELKNNKVRKKIIIK